MGRWVVKFKGNLFKNPNFDRYSWKLGCVSPYGLFLVRTTRRPDGDDIFVLFGLVYDGDWYLGFFQPFDCYWLCYFHLKLVRCYVDALMIMVWGDVRLIGSLWQIILLLVCTLILVAFGSLLVLLILS